MDNWRLERLVELTGGLSKKIERYAIEEGYPFAVGYAIQHTRAIEVLVKDILEGAEENDSSV